MIEFNEEYVERIHKKLDITKRNSLFLKKMFDETKNLSYFRTFESMQNCLNFWTWDKYEKNKLLDLQKVNRCKSKYCPNCRSVGLSIAVDRFSKKHEEMLKNSYFPVFMTLTIPNCFADDLKSQIEKMQVAFRKFIHKLSRDDKKGMKERLINVKGAVRVLEITKNKRNNTYHPHFHVLAYIDSYDELLFKKRYQGLFRIKSNDYMLNSDLDYHIQKLWTFCFDDLDFRDWNDFSDFNIWNEEAERMIYYQCDCKEIDMTNGGVNEVFKYCFKDTDIENFDDFKLYYETLYNKTIRQCYGMLHGMKLDCEDEDLNQFDEDILNYLFFDKMEKPSSVLTKGLDDSKKLYHDFKKISRHRNVKQALDLE